MSEHEHDEIARRLRETGTVQAPDRLRADVMDQVRAEPRMRLSRRSFLAPVLPYAAAAAALVVVVLALAHFGGGGAGSNSAGGGASAPGPERSARKAGAAQAVQGGNQASGAVFSLAPDDAKKLTAETGVHTRSPNDRTVIVTVPSSRYPALRQRLHRIEQRTHHGKTIRVILKRRS
jgi:hypothetical protein